MANAVLAFPITSDNAAATYAGGSWVAALPLTNLKDDRLARVTRSTSASLANAQFTIDFGIAEWIRFVALVDHNFSRTSAVRVRGSNTAGDWSVTTYDSGWFDGWPVTSPLYVAPVGDASWLDGRMSATEAADYNLSAIYIAASATAARYWKIEISDIGNTAGYVQMGRLVMSRAWQPTINMSIGAKIGINTETSFQRSDAGPKYFNVQPRARSAAFTIQNMDTDEIFTNAFEMQRQLGLSKQLFFVWDASDKVHLFRRSFLATLRDLSPIEAASVSFFTAAFSAEEVL
ncbi:hypothetical protein UFOVP842_54 [uncultured Caudovirales phage]|uniref:Uncharacterized protein n=1 Tax=uncultured Caudovirales phage TaxID=2100421 RepID=A0A6J5LQC8_9CAUD|nr:hypothetical protein UFOVP305_1 [uncultured Caudovirales phage]CAB4152006.1 hypothetical protein UFOVP593_44 [uncultured Caudovirales phage]CAB4166804.1 hypothetical protein UFOVP842_54 [uncultured Caudovirales phage]